MNIFSTNRQLRNEVKLLTETIKQVRDSHYHTTKYAAKLEVEQRSLLRQIEFLTPKKTITKAPSRPVERAKKAYAALPTSNHVLRPTAETPVRKEDESNSVNSFLAGAAIGYVIGEVFNDSSSSNSSSSVPDSPSFDSGGGGSFGGGGASSDW